MYVFTFCRPTWQVGRQLAMIGDDINDRYQPQFNQMISMLALTPDTAYEAFAGVVRKYVQSYTTYKKNKQHIFQKVIWSLQMNFCCINTCTFNMVYVHD